MPTICALLLTLLLLLTVSTSQPSRKQLTLAVVSGAEGEALKQAARDYEAQPALTSKSRNFLIQIF